MNIEYDLQGPAMGESEPTERPVLDRNELAMDVLKLVRQRVVDDYDIELAASDLYKLIYEYVSSLRPPI